MVAIAGSSLSRIGRMSPDRPLQSPALYVSGSLPPWWISRTIASAPALELGHERIGRRCFVCETQTRDAGGCYDSPGPLEGHADEADP